MDRTPVPHTPRRRSPTSTGIADWFAAHTFSRLQGVSAVRAPEVAAFINHMWPIGVEYSSPLNPIFLSEFKSVEGLKSHRTWLSRDGLVPLLWFFNANPTPPKGAEFRLLIHESFAGHVPSAWRPRTGTFKIETPAAPSKATSKLLLVGIMMDTFCSVEALKVRLQSLVDSVGKAKLKKMQISAFLPGRFDGWGAEHKHEYHFQFMSEVTRVLGHDIQALNWSQLEGKLSLQDYLVCELNEQLLCSDSFLIHTTLSRGARSFDSQFRNGNDQGEWVRLSPYHGMRIKTCPDPIRSKRSIKWPPHVERFEEAMQSEANQRFPWPRWFGQWAQSSRE